MAQIGVSKVGSSERGAALVELALILPLLLVVIAGIVDFGFAFQRYEVVANAAREGARLGSMSGYNQAFIQERVRQYVKQGLNLSDTTLNTVMPAGNVTVANPDVTIPLSGGGTVVAAATRVNVFYHHRFMLLGPIMGLINASWGQSITLRSSTVMRVEANGAGGS